MSQCASPSERCFVHVVIQQLFSIPRELWSKVSTVVVVNKQIPLDRYGVQGMYSHLTRHMQRAKWIIHMILAISFLAQHEHLHVTVIWWSVLNDSLVSYFPRGNHEEFLPPRQTLPSLQDRNEMKRAREHISHLDIQKSTGSGGMYPGVLRGLADTISRLL